jgi:hypothetical protein
MPEPSGGVAMKGRHVTVYADPEIPVCPNAVALADRFVEDVASTLGVSPPAIDYYVMNGPTGCGRGQYAGADCTFGTTVYAKTWIHFHELVHAVDNSHPPALFVEGIAEALSWPSKEARRLALARGQVRLDFDSPTFRAGVPLEEYKIAGDFVRYLVDRFGGVKYRAFAASVLSLADGISMRREFTRVFGATIDDVVADWRVWTPIASTLTVPVDNIDCQDPIAPVAPDTWRVDRVESDGCESGMTPLGARYWQQTGRYGFEVATPGVFLVEAEGDYGNQKGMIRSCAADALYEYRTSGTAKRFMALPLPAGRHAIDMVDGATSWRVERMAAVGDSCETAPIFRAPERGPWHLDIRGTGSTWLRIAHDGSYELYGTGDSATAARACWGSCSNLRCQAIAYGAPIDYPTSQPLYIVLGATSTPSGVVAIKTIESDAH